MKFYNSNIGMWNDIHLVSGVGIQAHNILIISS